MKHDREFGEMLKFTKNESGSTSIEFVLWLPLIFTFVLIAADATMAFMRQSQLWQISRETARIVSRYGLTEAEAENLARVQGTIGGVEPTVDVDLDTVPNHVIVLLTMDTSVLAPFGIITFVSDEVYTTRTIHAMEPLS